jgi:general secretion pathway protein G
MTQIAAFHYALQVFESHTGLFPPTRVGLQMLVAKLDGMNGWKGPYMKDVPADPWGRPYVYVSPGRNNPNSYDLYSLGADGREGTEDDVTNWNKAK